MLSYKMLRCKFSQVEDFKEAMFFNFAEVKVAKHSYIAEISTEISHRELITNN